MTMMKYLIGMLTIAGLMLLWAGIQHLWRQSFSDSLTDQDVLAGRMDCSNCGCLSACEKKKKIVNTKTIK